MEQQDRDLVFSEDGSIQISEEVVAVIAGVAATEVDGVSGMSGNLVGDISEMLGKKNLSKGVKVEVGEKEAAIHLYLVVDYGVRIPNVALKVQQNVKDAVEGMTGLQVVEVNIHIQGISFGPERKEGAPEVKLR